MINNYIHCYYCELIRKKLGMELWNLSMLQYIFCHHNDVID